MPTQTRIGTSGWVYPPWRGAFYPRGLAKRRELEYLSRQLNSVELNGSFYSLQRPERYQAWAEQTPEGFAFAVKGARFITHLKRLRDATTPLANFLASGVLALGPKLGPVLWQLPPNLAFEPDVVEEFLAALPHDTTAAARLARHHDHRLEGRAYLEADAKRPVRHAIEVRHPSFIDPAFVRLARKHRVAVVVADSAGTWPYLEKDTADFGYLRLHGAEELYVSGYPASALDRWAELLARWRNAGMDSYAYFDNDVKVHAPFDAMALAERLG